MGNFNGSKACCKDSFYLAPYSKLSMLVRLHMMTKHTTISNSLLPSNNTVIKNDRSTWMCFYCRTSFIVEHTHILNAFIQIWISTVLVLIMSQHFILGQVHSGCRAYLRNIWQEALDGTPIYFKAPWNAHTHWHTYSHLQSKIPSADLTPTVLKWTQMKELIQPSGC